MPPTPVVQLATHESVIFTDGDPVDPEDFISIQALLAEETHDRLLALLPFAEAEDPEGELGNVTGGGARRLYVPRVAGGLPTASTGLSITLQAGWIYAVNGGITGPAMLGYNCPVTNDILTMDAADAVNPRIDLIQVKLELVDDTASSKDFEDAVTRELTSSSSIARRRRVQATWSVKNGTPAANPTIPIPDVGNAAWAAIRVEALATTYDTEDLYDMRIPMRIEVQRIHPGMMQHGDTWAIGEDDDDPHGMIKTANDTKALWAFPHTGQMGGRILGAGANYLLVDGAGNFEDIQLMRLEGTQVGSVTKTEITNLFSEFGSTVGVRERAQVATEFAVSTGGGMGPRPIWTNFFGTPELWVGNTGSPAIDNDVNRVAIRFRGDALSEVYEAWFVVALDL